MGGLGMMPIMQARPYVDGISPFFPYPCAKREPLHPLASPIFTEILNPRNEKDWKYRPIGGSSSNWAFIGGDGGGGFSWDVDGGFF